MPDRYRSPSGLRIVSGSGVPIRAQRITMTMSQVDGRGRVLFTDSCGVSFASIGMRASGSSEAITTSLRWR